MVKKILVMKSSFPNCLDKLKELAKSHDREVEIIAPKSAEEYIEMFRNNDVDIVVNTWYESQPFGPYSPEVIRAIAKCGVRGIVHQGAGYDMVGDMDIWRKETNVQIANCPNAPAPDTADTAIYLLLATMRRFRPYELNLRDGKWTKGMQTGLSPKSATLGILGMGNIGKMIRDRAIPFQFKQILYHQRRQLPSDIAGGAEFESDLDTFLSKCDAIVVVLPHTKATHHLLNRERLMNVTKPGAIIVNVGRGPIIDEPALGDALETGAISAAGLDVFEQEPNVHPKLLQNERSVLLPHMGTFTGDALVRFENEIFDNIKSLLETGKVVTLVSELNK